MAAQRAQSPEERYFEWLYGFIGLPNDRNPSRSRWLLAGQLFRTEFKPIVPNDQNRESDGIELRKRWAAEGGDWDGSEFVWTPCSMLEMIIALAIRLDYQVEKTPGDWFWELMQNLGLGHFTDDFYMHRATSEDYISMVLRALNQRNYEEDGSGGLFPLSQALKDQRQVEIWYQAAAYLLESGGFGD